jgi:hypothetical protein
MNFFVAALLLASIASCVAAFACWRAVRLTMSIGQLLNKLYVQHHQMMRRYEFQLAKKLEMESGIVPEPEHVADRIRR